MLRIILILFAFFVAFDVNSAVLDNYYKNPADLVNLNNKRVILNYVDFHRAIGYNFNSYGVEVGLPFNNLKIGISPEIFIDSSDDIDSYKEFKVCGSVAYKLKNLGVGIGVDYFMTSLKLDSQIDGVSYSEINVYPGITYRFVDYNLGVSFLFYNMAKQKLNLSYYFNDLNNIGINFEKDYSCFIVMLSGMASIIRDKVVLYFDLSPIEYSPGLKFKLPIREKQNFLYLIYNLRYNIYTGDSHLVSLEINF